MSYPHTVHKRGLCQWHSCNNEICNCLSVWRSKVFVSVITGNPRGWMERGPVLVLKLCSQSPTCRHFQTTQQLALCKDTPHTSKAVKSMQLSYYTFTYTKMEDPNTLCESLRDASQTLQAFPKAHLDAALGCRGSLGLKPREAVKGSKGKAQQGSPRLSFKSLYSTWTKSPWKEEKEAGIAVAWTKVGNVLYYGTTANVASAKTWENIGWCEDQSTRTNTKPARKCWGSVRSSRVHDTESFLSKWGICVLTSRWRECALTSTRMHLVSLGYEI